MKNGTRVQKVKLELRAYQAMVETLRILRDLQTRKRRRKQGFKTPKPQKTIWAGDETTCRDGPVAQSKVWTQRVRESHWRYVRFHSFQFFLQKLETKLKLRYGLV